MNYFNKIWLNWVWQSEKPQWHWIFFFFLLVTFVMCVQSVDSVDTVDNVQYMHIAYINIPIRRKQQKLENSLPDAKLICSVFEAFSCGNFVLFIFIYFFQLWIDGNLLDFFFFSFTVSGHKLWIIIFNGMVMMLRKIDRRHLQYQYRKMRHRWVQP